MKETQKKDNPKGSSIPIKHFLLDPVKNPKEASARIKELIPYLAVSFGLTILFIILSNAIEAISGVFKVLGGVCMLAVFLFGFCMFRAFQLKKRLGNRECPACKTIIDGSNVTFEVFAVNFTATPSKTKNSKAGMDLEVHGVERTSVDITCKCQQCGTEKTFRESFKTADVTIQEKGISALNADTILLQMKSDMIALQQRNFKGANSDYNFKVKTTPEKMVRDYFNDDGTCSKIGNSSISASKSKK